MVWDERVRRAILKAPGAYRLVWQERDGQRWRTVHCLELKRTLSRKRFDLVYRDARGQVTVGQGTKTQIFNRMRERVCDTSPLYY